MTRPLLLLGLLPWALFADTVWNAVPGRLLPPFFRHIGIMPLAENGLAPKLWEQYAKSVTAIVTPYDEVAAIGAKNRSHVHFLVDLGNWDFANREAMLKRAADVGKVPGRFAGWILSGNVGSMLTNPKEFDEFRKALDGAKKDTPLFLACRYEKGTSATNCLPPSLRSFFAGIVWDVRFPLGFDLACLGRATDANCRASVQEFYAGLLPARLEELKRDEWITSWSFRLPLSALALQGDPTRTLKALYAFFMNEPRGLHFLLAMDSGLSEKVQKKTAPYQQVGQFLQTVTTQFTQRNLDIGSDLETPAATNGREAPPAKGKAFGKDGWRVDFAQPFFLNRFVVRFLPADRPEALSVYAGDGEATYYLGRWKLPALTPSPTPVVLFTETFHFPRAKTLYFVPEKGKLTFGGGQGWPVK